MPGLVIRARPQSSRVASQRPLSRPRTYSGAGRKAPQLLRGPTRRCSKGQVRPGIVNNSRPAGLERWARASLDGTRLAAACSDARLHIRGRESADENMRSEQLGVCCRAKRRRKTEIFYCFSYTLVRARASTFFV